MAASHLVFNSAEVRFIERDHAATHDGDCFDLMLKAGQGLYRRLMKKREKHPGAVWVFCGKGNNGGDGYVVAASLKSAGIEHRVFAVGEPHQGGEAAQAYALYLHMGGHVEYALPDKVSVKPGIIVDALLGTGIKSAPSSPVDEWILFINRLKAYTIAVDIPSGANADTGAVAGDCVRADLTVCMLTWKPGLLTGEAVDYTGKTVLEKLGVDTQPYFGHLQEEVENASPLPALRRTYEDIREDLPLRQPSANKGDNGKVLIVGGSRGYGGAALMGAMGALRAGEGLLKVALDPSNVTALNARLPEAMTVDSDNEEALVQALDWADVVALGPGLGTTARSRALFNLVESCDLPLIYDADALNLLSLQNSFCAHRILTPHPGEAARLLGCKVSDINGDRLMAARALQERFGGVVLLKGAGSVICDGRTLTIIQEGSAAMATGGMGDLLTGITVALVAEGLTLSTALTCAACVHGKAGASAGEEGGVIGTTVSDLLPYVRALVNGVAETGKA